MDTNKQKNSPISAERFVFHFQFFTATPIFFLLMPFFSKRVIHSSVFAKERSAVFEFWIRNGWFHIHAVQIKDHRTRLPFPSPVCYGPHPTSYVVLSFIPCLFFYSRHFVPPSESFDFRNRRPSGADHLNGFQPSRNTIACLQFDQAQRFESFALQLYGEFNWK